MKGFGDSKKTAKKQKNLARRARKNWIYSNGKVLPSPSDADTDSSFSGNSTILESEHSDSEDEGVSPGIEFFEDQMEPLIEELSEMRSSPIDKGCLEKLSKGLASRYCPGVLIGRMTMIKDVISRTFKKGTPAERVSAVELAVSAVVQYGDSMMSHEISRNIRKPLLICLNDDSVAPVVRESYASALGVMTLTTEKDIFSIWKVMDELAGVFSRSCGSAGEIDLPFVSVAESKVHRAALLSWGMLLTVAEERAQRLIERHLATVTALLHSAHVHVRVAAGTVLALIHEIAREENSDFEGDDLEGLCDDLRSLASDGRRYRNKRERRMQRASFRQIERSVRDGDKLCIKVRFEKETMWIESWVHKLIYEALCRFLSSGMNRHLAQNPVIRRLFDLGAPKKIKRAREHKAEPAEIKQRTRLMAELRLKRMDTGPDMYA